MPRHKLIVVALIALTLSGLSACAPITPPARALTPVVVQLRWTHNAQFAGLYAADQKGYYAAEGLAVTLREGGPQVDYLAAVLDSAAQFGITNADSLITARAGGKPLRTIAVVFRRNPTVFMALANSGITRPQDFVGKTIQVGPAGIPFLTTVLSHAGIRPDQYTTMASTPDLSDLYSGRVDGRVVFLTNEVVAAQAAGYKLNLIYPDDYGVHFYADAIFSTDDLIAKDPDLMRRFLRATLKGWTFAVENPTAIGPMVLKYNTNADAALETAKMTASLPLINTGEDNIGWMKPEIWSGMEKTLREQGVLTQAMDVMQVYTLQFVREIYGK